MFLFVKCGCDEIQVEKIQNVVSNGRAKALNYQWPIDNRRYFGNSIPKETIDYGSYDFIIVGSGSAGSILANRLSEIDHWSILLLEAGGDETDFTDIPSMMFYSHLSSMNWGYNTTRQKTCCLGMKNNQCTYPRGRVTGGSSTINALMYVRGNKANYDSWSRDGNTGWSYEEVLPYFKKFEHFELTGDKFYHSEDGSLNVSNFRPTPNLVSNFLQANHEMGRNLLDYNGRDQMGYSRLQMNINNGKRASGGRVFLDPIRSRLNLKIVNNALATKILIDKLTKEAYGLTFIKDKIHYKVLANIEVIISAGAINSPQLLMLSGIGPKKHLKNLDIPVIANLPVGLNLHDHPVFYGLNIRTNTTLVRLSPRESARNYVKGRGPLTYCANTQAISFINSNDFKADVPNTEIIFLPPPSESDITEQSFNYREDILNTFVKSANPSTDFRLLIVYLSPKSRGSVTLKSNNPLDFPNIDVNYFSDKFSEDIDGMYKSILFALSMLDTEAFKKINATLAINLPVCNNNELYSRAYWHCAIRHLSYTLYHGAGTTKMGPNPRNSVVNNKLKVHGICKLRVVDAGIIPTPIYGHPNAPTFMIGEKCAQMIKEEYLEHNFFLQLLKDNEYNF